MFFNRFPSFPAAKAAARSPEPAHAAHTTPTPSKKPSRLQNLLRALRLSRPEPRVEVQYHHPQVDNIPPAALQRPFPTTHEGLTLSTSARPSTGSTPSYLPYSTLSATHPAQLTVPRSASTTPSYSSSPPAAFVPKSPLPATLPATDPAVVFKRIAYLESIVSQLERDNARQLSETNALFENKILPGMKAFAKERDAEKAARNLAEDRLAGEIASHAKTEEAIIKEQKLHRRAERARLEVCSDLQQRNTELQAALLNLQTTTELLDFEALQESLVRLGIVHPDDQQYPQTFCVAPFLKSVCAAAKRGPNSKERTELKHNQELATAAYQAFDGSDDGDGHSEPVSDEPPRALSRPPAPTQWFKNGATRPK
ncbi:hypothetical protein FRC04_004667, partial [Tulasnella sp. 424]